MLTLTAEGNGFYTRHQRFRRSKDISTLDLIKRISEINLSFCLVLFSSFLKFIFVAQTMLPASALTATPYCFTPNESTASDAASFVIHLATQKLIISLNFSLITWRKRQYFGNITFFQSIFCGLIMT